MHQNKKLFVQILKKLPLNIFFTIILDINNSYITKYIKMEMTISELDSILQEGIVELKKNNTSLALKKFQTILPNKHINPVVFALVSQCYINLNNFKKAPPEILKILIPGTPLLLARGGGGFCHVIP